MQRLRLQCQGAAQSSSPSLMLDSRMFKGKGPEPANVPIDPGRGMMPLKKLIIKKHTHTCKMVMKLVTMI